MQQNNPSNQNNLDQQFEILLNDLKSRMHNVLHERDSADRLGISRGWPPFVLREIMTSNPFSAVTPVELGGLGGDIAQSIALMSAASYESLALSLTFGINMALFLQPTLKYGQAGIKKEVAKRFVNNQNMGGLMITEPDFGSDALSMRTYNTKVDNGYHINGTKHWAGLTGWADFWLLTSRAQTANGTLARDIDFFVADMSKSEQQIVVEERFENLGLYQIPYGRNRLDLVVPEENK
ncbi:MAG: acyl-CoA/acyl-ACP dehydrogenase, partial [Breznakibacter sp.]|nr:acyl-CoA/acyl-ACP dehydrogenase [Breznakibacter sp.]